MGHEYCNFDWSCARDPAIDIRTVIKKQSKIENRLKSRKIMLVVPVGKPEGQRWRWGGEGGHHRCSLLHCSWVGSSRVCPTAQWVKNLPAAQETWETQVWTMSREDPWRRKWQPTPTFLPKKSHGHRSLLGYSPKGLQRVRHDWVTKHVWAERSKM